MYRFGDQLVFLSILKLAPLDSVVHFLHVYDERYYLWINR
jgi:hypothetical protein